MYFKIFRIIYFIPFRLFFLLNLNALYFHPNFPLLNSIDLKKVTPL